MSHSTPLELIFSFAFLGCYAVYTGFKRLSKEKQLKATPISPLSSVAEGFIEVTGNSKMLSDNIIKAPLSGQECCAYYIIIKEKNGDNWDTTGYIRSQHDFLIED